MMVTTVRGIFLYIVVYYIGQRDVSCIYHCVIVDIV